MIIGDVVSNSRTVFTNIDLFQVVDFSMPLFMTMTTEGQAVSLSDHEALLGVYTIEEMNVYNESLPRRALDSHW